MNKKLFNKQLLTIGAGTLGAMFAGAVGSSQMKNFGGTVGKYAVPLTAGGLVVAGSMMMSSGNATAKKAGMGVGGVGVSLLANETYNVVAGKTLQGTPRLGSGSNESSGNVENPPIGDPVYTV